MGRPFFPRFISALLLAALAAAGAIPLRAATRPNPNILVLNSYSPTYRWAADAYAGVVGGLESGPVSYQLFAEYMDWKRFSSAENLDALKEVYAVRYSDLHIDLIVAVDDAALLFALENRSSVFSDAPIVFTGVLPGSAEAYLAGKDRVTGVYENIDPEGTIRAALAANPKLSRVYVYNERTESGLAIEKETVESIRRTRPELIVHSLTDYSLASFHRTISILPENSILLVGTCYTEVDKQVFSMDATLRKIARECNVPVYVLYSSYMLDGVMGGSLLDSRDLGNRAAEMAIEILEGIRDESARPEAYRDYRLTYNSPVLKRFGIRDADLPRGARVVNKESTFFSQYPRLSFVLLNILAVLIAAVVFLSLNNRKIRRIAYRDSLTGLVNQRHVFDTSDKILARTESGKKAGLLHLDLDDFRIINDVNGHAFGDLVLKEAADRLKELLTANMRAARFGGDEFLVLVKNADMHEIMETTRSVQKAFTREMSVNGKEIKLDITMGLAVYPDHGRDIRQLLQNTDMAMHQGKHGGKNRCILFNFDMAKELSASVDREARLRAAIANGELKAAFQPQVNLERGELSGFETLVRWTDPRHGDIPPSDFIPLAEKSRLIVEIGDFVIRQTLWFIQESELLGHEGFTVGVNVSVRQFEEPDFVEKLLDAVRIAGVSPMRLVLEVTESVMIAGMEEVSHKLIALRDAGFRIALDDFGTGYSSLNYLRELPIHTVKIDKSFADSLLTDARSQPLTLHIIGLCHELGLSVVAEGIESREQRDFLRRSGCDEIQGYFYSKPLSGDAALRVLGANFKDHDTIS